MRKAWINNELKESLKKVNLEKSNMEILKNELKVIDAKIEVEMKLLDVFCKIEL